MATVIGKTSDTIEALIANLVETIAVVDGNLIVTEHDGTTINVGGVGGPNSVMRVFYTSGAYPARPAGALCVEWIGPTQPPNMTNKDTWVQAG
jgi:hypothetical protein